MFAARASRVAAFLRRASPSLLRGAGAAAAALATASAALAAPAPPAAPAAAARAPVADAATYQRAYDAIAALLEDEDHDDGSWGPIFVRLAWHAAGTYDAASGTGGSNGATMRFPPESAHGANAGLGAARARLERIRAAFPALSVSDIWSLAGVCAIQEMGGPSIPWRAGRTDAASAAACTPDGRLPDASKAAPHLRGIFGRMGFSDREIVALSGAHALGRCHTTSSGFEGPWTFSPTMMSNDYFVKLLGETWVERQWAGPRQFEDARSKSLMMLPSDLALIQDAAMRKHVEAFAKDQALFFAAFADAFQRLGELGVPFAPGTKAITLARTQ